MSTSFSDGAVLARDGTPLLLNLPAEISGVADPLGNGSFLVARAAETSSRHKFGFGTLAGLERFTACRRDEPYWMLPVAGTALRDVPPETQYLLARLAGNRWLILIPLLDEPFRFSLLGKDDDSLVLLAETGDAKTHGLGGLAAYVAVGDDPYELCRLGAQSVSAKLGGGKLRRDKPVPAFLRDFGWCTWDAFYQEVSEEKVLDGLEQFKKGGVSPRLLILDDGWQSVERRPTGEKRLTAFAANSKFPDGLRPFVVNCKERYGIRSFLVWHALIGYWGGVDGERLPGYGVIDQTRQFSEGILYHQPMANVDWWGNLVGFVAPERIARFYDDYHALLASQGVDGVKVDSQAVLEGLAFGQGSRVALSKAYRAGLERSVMRHFDGRLINCMSNAQETYYYSPDSTLIRTSIDFFPKLPESHGLHLYTNAQVGLWFGEFMHPDWDMFQSGHEWGGFHAAARAICGGPVYVSDRPGSHDFGVLKSLVCSDGSVLVADRPALPTLDVLCHDPTREDVLLKIWSRNGSAGVVGVFNARASSAAAPAPVLRGSTGPSDVPGLEGERFACHSNRTGTLRVLGRDERIQLELGERGYELLAFAPIRAGFAAVGLTDKLNSGGAVSSTEANGDGSIQVGLRDGGNFLAYSERAPVAVEASGQVLRFDYRSDQRTLRVTSPLTGPHTLSVRF